MTFYFRRTSTECNNLPYVLSCHPLVRQACQGILRRQVDETARLMDLTDKEMASILNMSVRVLHGKDENDLLSLAASERFLLLKRLIYPRRPARFTITLAPYSYT